MENKILRVLVVTNMYPIDQHKYYGIFVKEQMEALSRYYPSIVQDLYFIKGIKSKFEYLKSLLFVNLKIIQNEYDIIHIHFGLSGLFTLFNPFIKAPIITMLHSADIDKKKSNPLIIFLSKLVVRRSTFILYLNDEMKSTIKSLNNRIQYLPCGVNLDMFNYIEQQKENEYFTLGFPGNPVRPEKNYKFFEKLIKLLKDKGLIIKVIIFHNMSREEVVENLSKCDVLIMTSISEGSPQIVKEAMSCNIPVISSNVGDVNVLLSEVKHCYVINDFNEHKFIERIMLIFDLKSENRKSNGRDKIIELGLDNKEISKKIVKIYEMLIKNAS